MAQQSGLKKPVSSNTVIVVLVVVILVIAGFAWHLFAKPQSATPPPNMVNMNDPSSLPKSPIPAPK